MRRLAYWFAGLIFLGLVVAKFSPQTGFSRLIRFGETWRDRRHSALANLTLATVPQSNGYDGQFYAQIALDPLLQGPELEKIIDLPAYRARRILLPATAAVIGSGDAWRTVQVYALLNVACWFAFAGLLYREIAADDSIGFARWVGCVLSLGVLDSVRQSLVDLPALLLLTLAVRASVRDRLWFSTLWLALGNLTRETTLLGSFALNCDLPFHRVHWRKTALGLLIGTLPLIFWSIYVNQRFGNAAGSFTGNFGWPMVAAWDEGRLSLTEIVRGNLDGRFTFGLLAIIGLSLQCFFFWKNRQWKTPWWRIGAVYSVLFLFLGSFVWSGYWAACRAVLPMTIAFNLLLPRDRSFWPQWIVGNLTLLHGVWRFL